MPTRSLIAALVAACFLAAGASLHAGKYNPTLSLGDAAPAWKDLPGVDGRRHSLADVKSEFVVVVFLANSCDVARDYEERILALAKKYCGPNGRVALVAINVSRLEEDQLPAMQERAKERGFSFPYLYDETQQIARDYGASWTPEFFVLNRERKIVYLGGMDDTSAALLVKKHYLTDALDALLAGQEPAVAETAAIGCAIRYARAKRTRP